MNRGNICDPPVPSFVTERERQQMRERATRRAIARVEDRAMLRQEVRALYRIQRASELIKELENARDLSHKEIAGKKAALDGHFKLLDRVLPPLKAVERDETPESQLKDVTSMSTAELLALARSQMPPLEAECTVVEPEPAAQPTQGRRHHGPEQWPFG